MVLVSCFPIILKNFIIMVEYGLAVFGIIEYGPEVDQKNLPIQFKVKNHKYFHCSKCDVMLYHDKKCDVERYFFDDKQICLFCYQKLI